MFIADLFQAKQNYERELLLHATDIESLTQAKQEASCSIFLYRSCGVIGVRGLMRGLATLPQGGSRSL